MNSLVGQAPSPASRQAFTLIELLVVVAIIAILASLLLPALSAARIKAKQAACISNQKQVALAWAMYLDDDGSLLPMKSNAENSYKDYFWYTYVYDATTPSYVKDPAVLRCSENTGGQFGTFWCTDTFRRMEAASQIAITDKDSGGVVRFRAWYTRIPAIANTTEYLLLACTSVAKQARTNPRYTVGSPFFVAGSFWAGGSWDQQGVWLSHNVANGLFADMHVEACNAGRLAALPNNRRTDTGVGGITAYKERDGLAFKDGIPVP